MSWITPKTNWVSSDYYNLEDAQRIAGNICHVWDMVANGHYRYIAEPMNIYTVRYVSYTSSAHKYIYYLGRSEIYHRSLSVNRPESYTRDLASWQYRDAENFRALALLILMTYQSAPTKLEDGTVIKDGVEYTYKYTTKWDVTSEPTGSFSATRVNNVSSTTGTPNYVDKPFTAVWKPSSGYYGESTPAQIGLRFSWGSNSYDVRLDITATSLANQAFYTAPYLNLIESKTLEVYNKAVEYWGE